MTEKALDDLEALKTKYGQHMLGKIYEFLSLGLGKNELEILSDMVDADRGETIMHPDTHAGTNFLLYDQQAAAKLADKGYLRREEKLRFSLTRKAFELFPILPE